ncbi:TPA: hypothetical protein EYN65_14355 [Candidatus Poribacteria bacterium]|jgi:hypothetical protein|nr:hypothetical protein [Candidatus Poribacteria bacterium]HIB90649.1 hypothetical protein [Candidatus Poribacteria bacterium]HIB99613.1 hypothetical protein [Candidatus Poribacteria bacterium]HIN29366.1 hypothetical protein [Candidatus Poribacteria bacterium]HIO49381.1 hypothetical protein [Candidatus Poribacteria bacterium]
MSMAQVTHNPAMADSSPVQQESAQQLKGLRTYTQPLLDTGKHAILQDILDHVTMRNLKQVQNIGNQMVTNYCVSDPWFQTLSSRDKVRYETDYQAQGCLPSYDVGCLLILVVKSIKLELPLYWREMGTLISTSYHRC